jgi:hypothetical protein
MSTATATATTSSISEVGRPVTPEAVAGRHHMVTQTLEYREDLSKKKVMLESFTQTGIIPYHIIPHLQFMGVHCMYA